MDPNKERPAEQVPAKKKRFLVVKLEDRVVPAHLPTHAVIGLPTTAADAPGTDVAGEANHKAVRFVVDAESVAAGDKNTQISSA